MLGQILSGSVVIWRVASWSPKIPFPDGRKSVRKADRSSVVIVGIRCAVRPLIDRNHEYGQPARNLLEADHGRSLHPRAPGFGFRSFGPEHQMRMPVTGVIAQI